MKEDEDVDVCNADTFLFRQICNKINFMRKEEEKEKKVIFIRKASRFESSREELKGGVNVFDIMRIYYRQFLVCTSHRIDIKR